jgi:putative acetyltransferase
VVVLGHPRYYPRFGFQPAAGFGLRCKYGVEPGAFQALELRPGVLTGLSGLVLYQPEFDEF